MGASTTGAALSKRRATSRGGHGMDDGDGELPDQLLQSKREEDRKEKGNRPKPRQEKPRQERKRQRGRKTGCDRKRAATREKRAGQRKDDITPHQDHDVFRVEADIGKLLYDGADRLEWRGQAVVGS